MTSPGYSTAQLGPKLGMYAQGYADRWPELSRRLKDLYRARIAKIPWIPSFWMPTVEALHGRESQVLVPLSSRSENIPFLDSDEKRAWWDKFSRDIHEVIRLYAANQQQAGAAELQRLNDNAVFYDNAYRFASVLASPVTAIKTLWQNPILTGVLLWGGLGIAVLLYLRKK